MKNSVTSDTEQYTNLVFVGGVEGNFGHFLVLFPHGFDGSTGQLDALEKSRFRGVTRDITLQDGQRVLCRLKHGSVTERRYTGQRQPRPRALVKGCTY